MSISPAEQAAHTILRTLREHGHQAFLAGGCVRDYLLGIPAKDFDVATAATPAEITTLFPRSLQVGAHFGVVVVPLELAGETVATEVATFRHDGAYTDGRRPDAVRFSTDPREDVTRRDFTVNGMLLDPFATGTGQTVLDFVGGRKDLAEHRLRTIGSPAQRFTEDKLRMLRAVRFAARLGFAIEPETAAAVRAHAAEIAQVSPERIRDELTRMLTEGQARRAFELLDQTGLLPEVLPEATRMIGTAQPPQYHPEGDVWIHTLLLLEKLPRGASPTLAWGMLLHDIGKPATYQPPDPAKPGDRIRFNGHTEAGVRIAEVICARLRFSNDDTAQILSLIANHMRFGDIGGMKQSTFKRFLRLPRFEEHLALHRADCLSSHGQLAPYRLALAAFETAEPEHIRPTLLVTGRDLIAAGYRPSPQFKAMLELAEDAQLEGRISTQEDGLALIQEQYGRPAFVVIP